MTEQQLAIERFDKALVYVDKLLPLFPSFSHFNISAIVLASGWTKQEIDEAYNLDTFIQTLLVDKLKYSQEQNGIFWLELTDLGREVQKTDGHFAYAKKLDDKEKLDTERQKLNDEKLKYDVKNSKRIFKTYWWTFAFAVVGLAISLVLGFLKLLEVFQQPPVK